jgi:Na+/melibiose symporter-like transporter
LNDSVRSKLKTKAMGMEKQPAIAIASEDVDPIKEESIESQVGQQSTESNSSADPVAAHEQSKQEKLNASTTLSPARRALLILGMFMSLFLSALDQTIVATALPTITADLLGKGSNEGGYTWVGSAFSLAQAVVLPIYGQAAELLGRRWTFLLAIAVFLVGSVLCGSAVNLPMLIAARVIQGIGAGGITSLVFILIGDLVSTKNRGKYQGFIGATWAVAAALGPVVGGVFAQKVSWRWVSTSPSTTQARRPSLEADHS